LFSRTVERYFKTRALVELTWILSFVEKSNDKSSKALIKSFDFTEL
jgi:hypothetical protein